MDVLEAAGRLRQAGGAVCGLRAVPRGLESRDPKVTIEMAEALAQRSPDSEYNAKLREAMFLAYRQSGANDKAVALAEKILGTDQTQRGHAAGGGGQLPAAEERAGKGPCVLGENRRDHGARSPSRRARATPIGRRARTWSAGLRIT